MMTTASYDELFNDRVFSVFFDLRYLSYHITIRVWQLMSYAFGPLIKMKKGQHILHNREEMFFLIQTAHFGLSQINGHNQPLKRHTIPTVMILLPLGQSVRYSMKRTRSVYE